MVYFRKEEERQKRDRSCRLAAGRSEDAAIVPILALLLVTIIMFVAFAIDLTGVAAKS